MFSFRLKSFLLSRQFLILVFARKCWLMTCTKSFSTKSSTIYTKTSPNHLSSLSISEKARKEASSPRLSANTTSRSSSIHANTKAALCSLYHSSSTFSASVRIGYLVGTVTMLFFFTAREEAGRFWLLSSPAFLFSGKFIAVSAGLLRLCIVRLLKVFCSCSLP